MMHQKALQNIYFVNSPTTRKAHIETEVRSTDVFWVYTLISFNPSKPHEAERPSHTPTLSI